MRLISRTHAFTKPSQLIIATSKCHRNFSGAIATSNAPKDTANGYIDVEELLAKPTWSVASLLPPKDQVLETSEVSSKQLHHLLRLSALPPPKDAEEERKMLSTLSSQLHFVKEIQKVDTTGVEPLRSLHDETVMGEKEAELGVEALKDALAQEEVRGKQHRRIRRRRDKVVKNDDGNWEPLGTARKKVGRFFVVEGGKDG